MHTQFYTDVSLVCLISSCRRCFIEPPQDSDVTAACFTKTHGYNSARNGEKVFSDCITQVIQ